MDTSISGYIRRHHLGLIAIFIALTGTAWAGTKVTSKEIKKNAIRAKHVKDGKLGTKDIADGTTPAGLTGADVVPNSLGADDVDEQSLYNDDSLDAGDIADNGSLGTAEVDESNLYNDDSLAANDLAADAVGSSEIGAEAVGASEVANDTIGSDEIVNSGGIEARLIGDFLTGRLASAADPNTAFLQVSDDLFSVGRSSQGGSNVGISFNATTLETTFFDQVDIENDFLELDEIPTPAGDPPSNSAWIYAREGAGTELVVEFSNNNIDVLGED